MYQGGEDRSHGDHHQIARERHARCPSRVFPDTTGLEKTHNFYLNPQALHNQQKHRRFDQAAGDVKPLGPNDGIGRFLIDGFPREMSQAHKFDETVKILLDWF
jgi:hypothetical protein